MVMYKNICVWLRLEISKNHILIDVVIWTLTHKLVFSSHKCYYKCYHHFRTLGQMPFSSSQGDILFGIICLDKTALAPHTHAFCLERECKISSDKIYDENIKPLA